jgi:hypothetical protein
MQANGDVTRSTYLLTIRRVRFDKDEAESFRDYFRLIAAAKCDVLVVDGSPSDVFAAHKEIWSDVCLHAPVDPHYKYLNGKVNGIHTGINIAAHERIILADDDIRYTANDLCRMTELLADDEMVRPQNYLLAVWPPMPNKRCVQCGDIGKLRTRCTGSWMWPFVKTRVERALVMLLRTWQHCGTSRSIS